MEEIKRYEGVLRYLGSLDRPWGLLLETGEFAEMNSVLESILKHLTEAIISDPEKTNPTIEYETKAGKQALMEIDFKSEDAIQKIKKEIEEQLLRHNGRRLMIASLFYSFHMGVDTEEKRIFRFQPEPETGFWNPSERQARRLCGFETADKCVYLLGDKPEDLVCMKFAHDYNAAILRGLIKEDRKRIGNCDLKGGKRKA